jgi:hypothetical protein
MADHGLGHGAQGLFRDGDGTGNVEAIAHRVVMLGG